MISLSIKAYLIALTLFHICYNPVSAQYNRDTTSINGQHVWSSVAGSPVTLTVKTAAMQPTLIYNCARLPAICNNVAQKYPGATRGMAEIEMVYDMDPNRKDARRNRMCPGSWKNRPVTNGRRCPEPDQPYIVPLRHGRPELYNSSAAVMEISGPNGPGKKPRSGMMFTCDEFPFASVISGGTGEPRKSYRTPDSTTYCAPHNARCAKLPVKGRTSEQDWQGSGNKYLRTWVSDGEGDLWAFWFKTEYDPNKRPISIEHPISGSQISTKVYGVFKRDDNYGNLPGFYKRVAEINQDGTVTVRDVSTRDNHHFVMIETREEILPSKKAPVQKEYKLEDAPHPIIDLSTTFILGQLEQYVTTSNASLENIDVEDQHKEDIRKPDFTTLTALHKRVDGPVQCGPDKECADGSCCNTDGKCGFKEAHCGANCLSNCNATAMCGIDSAGGDKKCGLNLCCSYYGWCGTEEVHCGEPEPGTKCQAGFGGCKIVPPPVCGENSGTTNGRRIAYYQSWNTRIRQCNRIMPSQIKTDGLTHLYFAFASIDPVSFSVKPADPADEALYSEFTALQSKGVKTWIAIGGYDFNEPGPTRTTWSDMTSTASNRAIFISSLKAFMAKYGFQGADLDWEYPTFRGGRDEDTANLVSLVKEMRASFGSQYGISSILAPDYWYLRGFDPKAMEPYIDWFGFMAYDLHGSWDTDVKTLGSKVRPQTDIREIDRDLLPLWFASLDPAKVNFGLAYYGRGYTLSDPNCAYMGCTFSGPSKKAACTNFDGVMSNTEIRKLIKEKGLVPELLKEPMVKQLTWDDQWIGYDDEETIALKVQFANNRCLGGTMIWSIDFDSGDGSGSVPDSTAPRSDGRCGPLFDNASCDADGNYGGCCSVAGYCGSSEKHCLLSAGCLSGCSSSESPTTPRDDGRCGKEYNDAICDANGPFGGCCSSSGYCGSTDDYCSSSNGCQNGCDGSNATNSGSGSTFQPWLGSANNPPQNTTPGDVYINPSIWKDPDALILCQPPCRLIMPPLLLSTTTTLFPPPLTTQIYITQYEAETRITSGMTTRFQHTSRQTVYTTITLPPVVTTEIEIAPVTIDNNSTSTLTFTYSVMPPPVTVTLASPTMSASASTRTDQSSSSSHVIIAPIPTLNNIDGPKTPHIRFEDGTPGPLCSMGCGRAPPVFVDIPGPGEDGDDGDNEDDDDDDDDDDDEDDDEEDSCPLNLDGDDDGSDEDGSTIETESNTSQEPATTTSPRTTLLTTQAPSSTSAQASENLNRPDPRKAKTTCYNSGLSRVRADMIKALNYFCTGGDGGNFGGNVTDMTIRNGQFVEVLALPDFVNYIQVSVRAKDKCEVYLAGTGPDDYCGGMLRKIIDDCDTGGEDDKHGGKVEDNCAVWRMDPQGMGVLGENAPTTSAKTSSSTAQSSSPTSVQALQTPDPNTAKEPNCYHPSGLYMSRVNMIAALEFFCSGGQNGNFGGNITDLTVKSGQLIKDWALMIKGPGTGTEYVIDTSVQVKDGCEVQLVGSGPQQYCGLMLRKVIDQCDMDTKDKKYGGTVEDNCATWKMDPQTIQW